MVPTAETAGTVGLLDGGTVLASGTLAGGSTRIEFDSTELEVGDNALTVRHTAGDVVSSAPVVVTVEKAPATLTATVNNTRPAVGANQVVATATVTAAGFVPTGL